MTAKALSFADLNVRKASETPFEFEYLDPDGAGTGFFLSVIGTHSDTILKASQEAEDARRKKEAFRAMKAAKSRPDQVDVGSVVDDVEAGVKLIAKRIVGWRGIDVDYSPEKALELCQVNPLVCAQVMEASNTEGHFTKASPQK